MDIGLTNNHYLDRKGFFFIFFYINVDFSDFKERMLERESKRLFFKKLRSTRHAFSPF